jgi:phospholipid:diacylglycerol acyltransferase
MLLDPYNQTDHPDCKSRPDSGLSGITELDPGYITGVFCISILRVNCIWPSFCLMIYFFLIFVGPLSSVWKEWIKWCIEFGIEANAIIAVPYDWRLSPSMLEERDLYFHKLKYVYYIFASASLSLLLLSAIIWMK